MTKTIMNNVNTFKPYNDLILVKPTPVSDMTKGGIIVPDSVSKTRSQTGTIIAVGPGKHNVKGVLIPVRLKVGQKVLFSANSYDEVALDNEKYLLLAEHAVLGTYE